MVLSSHIPNCVQRKGRSRVFPMLRRLILGLPGNSRQRARKKHPHKAERAGLAGWIKSLLLLLRTHVAPEYASAMFRNV